MHKVTQPHIRERRSNVSIAVATLHCIMLQAMHAYSVHAYSALLYYITSLD